MVLTSLDSASHIAQLQYIQNRRNATLLDVKLGSIHDLPDVFGKREVCSTKFPPAFIICASYMCRGAAGSTMFMALTTIICHFIRPMRTSFAAPSMQATQGSDAMCWFCSRDNGSGFSDLRKALVRGDNSSWKGARLLILSNIQCWVPNTAPNTHLNSSL